MNRPQRLPLRDTIAASFRSERQNLEARLDPRRDLHAAYRTLDERWRPYYEHRLAA